MRTATGRSSLVKVRQRRVYDRRLLLEQLETRALLAAFTPGSIDAQDGWSGGTIPIAAAVTQGVDQGGANAHSGTGAWLVSNSTANGNYNGNFAGWPFSPGLTVSAGQPSSGAGADRFSATYWFKSASAVADGSNMEIDLGTVAGDDRNTFMAITNDDDADGGLKIRMAEPNGATGGFFATQTVATAQTRGVYHRIDVQATFIDGSANDTFQVSLDGVPLLNPNLASPNFGTANFNTFEGFREGSSQPYALSNRLFFRSGSVPSSFGSFSDTGAAGIYVDDVTYQDFNSANPGTTLASYSAGFEPAGSATFDIIPAAVPTPLDNDYTRIANVLPLLTDGDTVTLHGTFNWTEPNAAASWALGNDTIAGTADDFSLLVPANLNNITFTALALGDARIQGPGDLAAANLEGVFVFDGGDNQDWTISNLEIYDFDLSIGFFNGAGGSDAFNGTTITNNHLRIPADLNATAAAIDVNQNIGIHYSFGVNQKITNNTLEIVGSGASDGTNFSSSIGMQSNTSGGAVYDGLLIDGNTVNVTGVLDAQPSTVLGIWDNGHAHTSDITVSNNDFFNLTGANSATNLMRAFRVTSHSGAATTVAYSGNTVDGANIGFQWLAGSNFAGNQPVQLWNNTITDSATGVLVQSNGSANVYRNTITGSGAGGAIQVLAGSLAASGAVTNAVQENIITDGSGDGILITAGAGAIGSIFGNDLSGNAGLGVNNLTAAVVDASGNWWGSNTPSGVAAEVSTNVDYTPWLDAGSDASADPGFQGDFSTLNVEDQSPQVGAVGRISEGLGLLLGGGTAVIHTGLYTENVDATTQGVTLQLGDGAANVSIAGDLALDSDDFLELQLGNTPGTTGDLLNVSGAVTLGGATANLSALETLTKNNTLVVLTRGSGSDFFGNVAHLQQFPVNGNLVTAHYDLGDGNDFGFLTLQDPSIGNVAGTVAYTENNPPTLLLPTATITDADSPVFNGGSLQVEMSVGAAASDILGIRSVGSGAGEIQVSGNQVQYEGNTFGTVSGGAGSPLQIDFTSDGNATLAAVQALLRSITFESTSDAPATTKEATFSLEDGTGGTDAVSKAISITLVNDAPVLDTSLNPTLTTIDEDAVNPAGTLVSTLLAGAVTDVDAGALQGIAVSAASEFSGIWEYSLDGGGTWTSMGAPTASAALLLPDSARVRFLPNANFNGTVKLWYHAWDQTQGTAGGTLPAVGQSNTASVGIAWEGAALTVLPINDVPLLNTALEPALRPTGEDALVPASTRVSDLIAGAITDPDAGALQGIAVSAASEFSGIWEYSLDDGGTWTSMGAPTAEAALLLPASARVRFDPNPDFNGTVKLWYHAWDQTEGVAGGTLSARHNPGNASVGNEWDGATLTVLPVNDAPVLTLSGTVGYVHDAPPIQLAPNATVTDIDSDNFDTGRLRVYITDGASSSNRLAIGAGFTVDDNDNVLQGALVIGKRVSNGFGTNELFIRFTADATPFRVQQLVRAITFKTVGGAAGERKVVFNVKDGDGGLSADAVKTVNVT